MWHICGHESEGRSRQGLFDLFDFLFEIQVPKCGDRSCGVSVTAPPVSGVVFCSGPLVSSKKEKLSQRVGSSAGPTTPPKNASDLLKRWI